MSQGKGGRRPGAGRPKNSKNKTTIAKTVVAEVLDIDDPNRLTQSVHQRGHTLLRGMEEIALDATQPVAVRIMAARTALPFLMPRPAPDKSPGLDSDELVRILHARRDHMAKYEATYAENRRA